jgi:hypothetical protein
MSFTAEPDFNIFSRFRYGWKPNHHPTFDPGSGFVVAHDVLEHRPDDRDCIEHELMAIGAGAYVKELDSNTAWQGYIGNDAAAFQVGKQIPEPKAAPILEYEAERIFAKGIEQFESRAGVSDKSQRVLGWWRLGYEACKRRYEGISQQSLVEAHYWVMKAADATRADARHGEQLMVETKIIETRIAPLLQVEITHLDNDGQVKFHETKMF